MRARTRTVAFAGAAAAVAGVAATVAADRRWARTPDPVGRDEYRLPAGESITVTTDDGAELAVTVAGPADGPQVVLAHCWMGAREVWAPVAHRLVAKGHRVTLYDQRGHGASTAGQDGFTITRLGADLRAVLEAVHAREAVLAGHSMGGMTVMSLTAHHPKVIESRAKALVLVATAAAGLARAGANFSANLIETPRFERLLTIPLGHVLMRNTFGSAPVRHHLVLTRDLHTACPGPTRRGCLEAMFGMDLREGLRATSVPATVIVGSRDQLTSPKRAREIVDSIAGAELVTLAGRGHWLPLEAPDDVAIAIAEAAAAPARATSGQSVSATSGAS